MLKIRCYDETNHHSTARFKSIRMIPITLLAIVKDQMEMSEKMSEIGYPSPAQLLGTEARK